MKIGIFTDLRYCKQKPIEQTHKTLPSLKKLKETMIAFQKQNVDLCFCMGNLVDQTSQKRPEVLECIHEAMELIRSYEIPFYLVPGPQDHLTVTSAELLEREELYPTPYSVFTDHSWFLLLNGNHRTDLQYGTDTARKQTEFYLPTQQIEYLKKQLRMTKNAVLLICQNLDCNVPAKFTLQNFAEVQKIILESGRIRLVLQGYYPKGADNVIDGIRYLSVPSMCENESDYFRIVEI